MRSCSISVIFLLLQFVINFSAHAACSCPDPTDCARQITAPCQTPSGSQYILRYSVAGENGAMTFIGNTLGLSKEPCMSTPGVADSIGAFITVDPSKQVGSYPSITTGPGSPGGTTLEWRENGSSANLNIPDGSTVLYAELIWSGSYGYYCAGQDTGNPIGVDPNCILMYADGPIFLTTPDQRVHEIIADPETHLVSQNPSSDVHPFYCAGNYTRSADVTHLFTKASLADPNGIYIVGGIPATVSRLDDSHNAAGWTLAIVYHHSSITDVNNMTLFVSNQQGSSPTALPAEISGFCADPSPTAGISARLLVSAIEGDASKPGDQMQFGPTPDSLTPLAGPNNPIHNFFGSQINDDSGALKNMTGTFCLLNHDPFTGRNVPGGRQGYDITNVDCSSTIMPGQTRAFARGSTEGDDFMINALGIQIRVNAPVVVPSFKVNNQLSVNAEIGDILTFSARIENTGSGDAANVLLQDVLEQGLEFIPNSFKVNGVVFQDADLVAGIPLGMIRMMDVVVIEFQAKITAPPLIGHFFYNFITIPFDFIACGQIEPFHRVNSSNVVTIDPPIPTSLIEPPGTFSGVLKKNEFLNRTMYALEATWLPSPTLDVVSYRIFKNGKLVVEIPASGPYLFATCVRSKQGASEFTLVAVDSNNVESAPLNLRMR